MTPRQRWLVIGLTAIIGLTRLLAVAHSLWDWDEALFTFAVDDYDVSAHHPHPPGYPLFIAAAKLVHLTGLESFRSLQVVVVLCGVAIFPGLFFLARALGYPFVTSVAGAALFSFLPNVWIYSGSGFSDVPAAALVFISCALLLRGRESARAYVLGAVVLAIAIGIRPASLLIGAVPGAMATWHRLRARSWRSVALAATLGALIAGGSYAGAALASHSVENYTFALKVQSEWVRDVDSWRSPRRPGLLPVGKLFFLLPVQHDDLMFPLVALAAAGLVYAVVRRRRESLLLVALFGPTLIVSWLELDFTCAARYSIAYLAMYTFLAVEVLRLLSRSKPLVHGVLVAVVVAVFIGWTWPVLAIVRNSDTPPVAALKWARRNAAAASPIWIHAGIQPQADIIMDGRDHQLFETPEELAKAPGNTYVVHVDPQPRGTNFQRERGRLWAIVRPRNFEAAVFALSNVVTFRDGWYGDEGDHRWMQKSGTVSLPSLPTLGTLRLHLYIPPDLATAPTVDVLFNGQLLETITGTKGEVERSWTLESRADAPNELRLVTSATVNPKRLRGSDDDRELGLSLNRITWLPVKQ